MRTRSGILIMGIAVALTACASFESIREMPPDNVFYVDNVNYRDISACVIDELRLNHPAWHYTRSVRPSRETVWVSAGFTTIFGTPAAGHAWALKLTQESERVRIETRSIKDIWGKGHVPDSLEDLVKECADALNG